MANEKFVITLDIDGQVIKADYDTIYSGLVGALKIKLKLTNWAEETTVLRFMYGEDEPIDIIVSGEYVDVPQNVIRSPGFTLAIGGYKSDGAVLERFVPTNAINIRVINNGYGSPDAGLGRIEDATSLEARLIALLKMGEELDEKVIDLEVSAPIAPSDYEINIPELDELTTEGIYRLHYAIPDGYGTDSYAYCIVSHYSPGGRTNQTLLTENGIYERRIIFMEMTPWTRLATEEYVETKIGDIDTALNNIITKYGLGGDDV